jgi:hypothetical protein
MCDECEQAEPLVAVYWRKANRHGWRPPVAAATTPRYDDAVAGSGSGSPQGARFSCASAGDTVEVDRCA